MPLSVRSVVLALVLPASLVAQQRKAVARAAPQLFLFDVDTLQANRVWCGLNNLGGLCVNPDVSPVIGGGFWPRGTVDQYVFSSGLQVAGIIPANAGGGRASFSWAGDTVGAYFHDTRGDQLASEALTPLFNSRSTYDRARWPRDAAAIDPSVFQPSLLGRPAVSDQDVWTRYWDGDPGIGGTRSHPMGIAVEQRAMVWNAPPDNRDIVYFVFRVTNVTARNAGAYDDPTVTPEARWDLAALGARFQDSSEAILGVSIPDAGYRIDSVYVALSMDPDVGDASFNYSNLILPFQLALAYKSDFLEPSWGFPPEIFGPPLAKGPGFVGVQFMRSATDQSGRPSGLVMFSNLTGSGTGYPAPVGVQQLWRYLAGRSTPAAGDNPCTFQGQQLARHYCFLAQSVSDTRFFMTTGPFSLDPGKSQTVIAAYEFAAATAAVEPYIGGDFKPGFPSSGDSIALDTTKIRLLERAAGWLTQTDANGDGAIDAGEVRTVPHSLLAKARVAQAMVDNKFLLPSAPADPAFFLIPGDNQVTVVWQKSPTETTGDPYFAVASDPTSALYDPNYRQFDVEGYRIYRGRDPSALQLVAQFDYAGTTMLDYTGDFLYDGECAPELGIRTDCPVAFDSLPPYGPNVEHPLIGDVVQVPYGGRATLNGRVFVVRTDTAATGGGSGFPALTDEGVTFSYIDRGVRNSFGYYYAVTAFDVNSLASGPSSQESARVVKFTTPRAPASNVRAPIVVTGVFGADGIRLDTAAAFPAIDSATGTFGGPLAPAVGASLTLVTPVQEVLPEGDIAVRIDSISAGFAAGIGRAPSAHLTLQAPGLAESIVVPLPEPAFPSAGSVPYVLERPLVPVDSGAARRFGLALDTATRMPVAFASPVPAISQASSGVSVAAGRFGLFFPATTPTRYLAHSRWFAEGGSEPPDPTIRGIADSSHNAGALPGVRRIWAPQAYRDSTTSVLLRGYSYGQTAWYPADFIVTWNADSSVAVFDSTHHGPLPLAADGGTGFGFINERVFGSAGITAVDLDDGAYSANIQIGLVSYHHLYGTPPTCTDWWVIACARMESRAEVEPIDFDNDGVSDGDGIAIAVNGEAFFMTLVGGQLPPAGTRWHLRAVSGIMTATCSPAFGPVMTDCSAYTFTPFPSRVAWAPGVSYRITVQRGYTVDSTTSGDLTAVHPVPDPYYVTNALETSDRAKVLKFVHLPSQAIIRIYSLSGVLVAVIIHNDATGGGEATWDLKSRTGKYVASGVYFYHVETADHRSKIGRLTLVMERP